MGTTKLGALGLDSAISGTLIVPAWDAYLLCKRERGTSRPLFLLMLRLTGTMKPDLDRRTAPTVGRRNSTNMHNLAAGKRETCPS